MPSSVSKKPGITQPSDQGQRFIEAARELGCDEDEDAFKERLRKLASAPPATDGHQKRRLSRRAIPGSLARQRTV